MKGLTSNRTTGVWTKLMLFERESRRASTVGRGGSCESKPARTPQRMRLGQPVPPPVKVELST